MSGSVTWVGFQRFSAGSEVKFRQAEFATMRLEAVAEGTATDSFRVGHAGVSRLGQHCGVRIYPGPTLIGFAYAEPAYACLVEPPG